MIYKTDWPQIDVKKNTMDFGEFPFMFESIIISNFVRTYHVSVLGGLFASPLSIVKVKSFLYCHTNTIFKVLIF